MSKRRQRLTIWDLGRIETTPVQREESVGTLKQFRESEDRKAREADAARQVEIERVQKDTSRLMAECLSTSAPMMTKFWSQPLDKIKPHIPDDSVFDNLFLPTSEDEVNANTTYDAIQKFLDDDVFTRGYSLGDISRRRFGLYVASQVNAGVVVNPASLAVMFDRCFDLGIFKNDEDTEFNDSIPRIKAIVEQPRVEQPVEQPRRETLDDLEAIDTSTRDGLRRAQNLAENSYISEMLPVATSWVTSIQKHYGFSPTSEDLRRVSNWIERNNLNRLDPRTYDASRRWLCASGYWPESCLMEEEKFNLSLESIDTSRLTVAQRNDLNRRELAARESDARRFGNA